MNKNNESFDNEEFLIDEPLFSTKEEYMWWQEEKQRLYGNKAKKDKSLKDTGIDESVSEDK